MSSIGILVNYYAIQNVYNFILKYITIIITIIKFILNINKYFNGKLPPHPKKILYICLMLNILRVFNKLMNHIY